MTLKSGLEVTEGHSNQYHSKAFKSAVSYSPSAVTGSILHHLWDKARYWLENRDFFIPLLHSTPPLGRSLSE